MANSESGTAPSTMDSEKGVGPSSSRHSHLKPVVALLRFLTFAATLSAFVVMVTDRQTKNNVLQLNPNTRLPFFGPAKAKFYYSDAFIWFVVANGIAFVYSLLTGLLTTVAHSVKLVRALIVLDLLVAYIILAGATAATAVAYIGENGLDETGWRAICSTFTRYCHHVLGALVASFLGWLFLTVAIILSIHIRH